MSESHDLKRYRNDINNFIKILEKYLRKQDDNVLTLQVARRFINNDVQLDRYTVSLILTYLNKMDKDSKESFLRIFTRCLSDYVPFSLRQSFVRAQSVFLAHNGIFHIVDRWPKLSVYDKNSIEIILRIMTDIRLALIGTKKATIRKKIQAVDEVIRGYTFSSCNISPAYAKTYLLHRLYNFTNNLKLSDAYDTLQVSGLDKKDVWVIAHMYYDLFKSDDFDVENNMQSLYYALRLFNKMRYARR